MPKPDEYSDPELERSTLAALIQSSEPFAYLDRVQDTYFTDESVRNVFSIVKELTANTGGIPTESTLGLELQKRYIKTPKIGESILTSFTQLSTVKVNSPLPFLLNNLVNYARAREMLTSMERSIKKLSDGDIEGALKLYQNDALSLQSSDPLLTVSRGEFVEDYKKRKDVLEDMKLHPEKYKGMPTGIDELDELTGGLWKGELAFVFGRTGVGKSFFLLETALTAYRNVHRVLVISIEMNRLHWARRGDSRVSHIPYARFKKAELSDQEYVQWEHMMGNFEKKYHNKGARLWITHIPFGCTVGSIRGEIENYRNQGTPIDILVMDYGDLINPTRAFFSEQAELTAVFKDLKGIAQLYNIPVWTASQSKAGTYRSAKLDVEDVGYAAGKAHVADLVVGISCTDEDQLAGKMSLHVVKIRDGSASAPITLRPKFEISMIDSKGM